MNPEWFKQLLLLNTHRNTPIDLTAAIKEFGDSVNKYKHLVTIDQKFGDKVVSHLSFVFQKICCITIHCLFISCMGTAVFDSQVLTCSLYLFNKRHLHGISL